MKLNQVSLGVETRYVTNFCRDWALSQQRDTKQGGEAQVLNLEKPVGKVKKNWLSDLNQSRRAQR